MQELDCSIHVTRLPEKNADPSIAFGRKSFEAPVGLYGVHDLPEKRQAFDGISLHAFSVSNRVVGATFSFLGFRLLLTSTRKGRSLPFMRIGTRDGGIEVIQSTYHPGIRYRAGKGVSHEIVLRW